MFCNEETCEVIAYSFSGDLIHKRDLISVEEAKELPVKNMDDPLTGHPVRRIINVDITSQYEEFLGAGAALTESSAWLIMNKLSVDQRRCLLEELFSQKHSGWRVVRICMGASDFNYFNESVDWPFWTYNDVENDVGMSNFSIGTGEPGASDAIKDMRWVIPVLQEIMSINPSVKVIAAPWSPPAWMKDNKSLVGGNFVYNKTNCEALTEYFRRFIESYKNLGIPIYALAVQNEPQASLNYPSCRWKGTDLGNYIKNYLAHMLYKLDMGVKIIGHDHNYKNEIPNYIEDMLSAGGDYIDAVGYHLYNGTVDYSHKIFKENKHLRHWMTEMRTMMTETAEQKSRIMLSQIINAGIQHGCQLITLWNLALDENGNPATAKKGRSGVITINSQTGEITRNLEYYALRSITQNVRPGARRVFSTTYNPSGVLNEIGSAAFMNINSDVTVIITNQVPKPVECYVRVLGKTYCVYVKPYGYVELCYRRHKEGDI